MASSPFRRVALRYLGLLALANLGWEVVQLPFFTLWDEGSWHDIAFAALHCTAGDVMIAASALGLALGRAGWPGCRFWAVLGAATILGFAYTVFSEWLNVEIRGAWAYGPSMPRIPPLGTGLTPLLQWLLLPPLAMLAARRAMIPSASRGGF